MRRAFYSSPSLPPACACSKQELVHSMQYFMITCKFGPQHIFRDLPNKRCHRHQWQRSAYSGYTGFAPGKDRTLAIKLSLAKISGSLDLSWLGLETLDHEIFQLTDLEELTIAGNRLQTLPDEICQLKNLKKLQAAGNLLHKLPDTITQLASLKGIWLHGNVIQELPHDIGSLSNLETLSLSGNCIQQLPDSVSQLTRLKELSISGNAVQELPQTLGSLSNLVSLSLNGNQLESVPRDIGRCTGLQNLHLQYNKLNSIPSELLALENLVELNLSDNDLEGLPEKCTGLGSCESIWLYGNRLKELPQDILTSPKLECLWIENNPLDVSKLAMQIDAVGAGTKLRELGLDIDQVANLEAMGRSLAKDKYTKSGKVPHDRKGYFKLRHAAQSLFQDGQAAEVLVITFASAPGTPNWGGLLGRYVAQASTEESQFDVLYVCDGSRNWYSAGDEGFEYWEAEIKAISKDYKEVIMLGDSMGASAALLFSHLATSVQAFTPQVDLANASIRPGKSQEWLTAGKHRIMRSVSASSAKILVHSGTWDHDLEQAKLLPSDKCELVVHHLDSHRLAIALHSQGQLLPIVRKSILSSLGLYSPPRLVNLL